MTGEQIKNHFLQGGLTKTIDIRRMYSDQPGFPLDYRTFKMYCREAGITMKSKFFKRKTKFTPSEVKKWKGVHGNPFDDA